MTFFSWHLLTTPIFPRRLSSVLSKFSHKNNFRPGVTRGGPLPPSSDATAYHFNKTSEPGRHTVEKFASAIKVPCTSLLTSKRLVTLSTYRRYTNNCIYLSI